MKRIGRFAALLFPLLFLAAAGANGFSEPGVQREPVPSFVPDEVLVQLKPGIRVEQILSGSPATLSVRDESARKGTNTARLKIKGGESLESAIAALSKREGVLFAQPNYIYHAALVPNDPLYTVQWGLPKIGTEEAWNLSTGSADVVVAVLDTGVDLNHPDLVGNIWTNPGEIPGNSIDDDGNGYVDDVHGWDSYANSGDVQDTAGHGTHVSGIIGAVGNNGVGVSGVNWTIRIVAAKASSGNSFTTIDLARGIDYVTALKEENNVNIVAINASLGGPVSEDPLLNQAIGGAGNAGILFVAAAGNENSNNDVTPFYPASLFMPHVLSVAATDENDLLAVFNSSQASNYGRRTVHIGAPGKNIRSTYRDALGISGYADLSGTSMAAPYVAGVLALLKAGDPSLGWIALKNKVLSSGAPLSSLALKTITGRRLRATGSGPVVQSRLRPIKDTIDLLPGNTVDLAALNISGETSLGNLSVNLERNGASYGTVTLKDDGTGFDQVAGDGIASATWTVPAQADSTYRFSFPDGTLAITVQLSPEPPPAPSGGGGGGGCTAATGPGLALLLFVPLGLAFLWRRR
jgi:subtilisin family serine protease